MIDVLIIGSGIAGLTAAINASNNNSKVLVLSKTYPTHSQSVQAQGGINAVLYEDDDSIETHINDTDKGSCFLANKENIKLFSLLQLPEFQENQNQYLLQNCQN